MACFFSFSSFFLSLFLNSHHAVKVKAPTPVTFFSSLLPPSHIYSQCVLLFVSFFCECGLFVFVRPSLRRQSRLQSLTPAARRFKSGEINKLSVIGWCGHLALVQPEGRGYAQSRSETLSSKPPLVQSNQLAEGLARSPPLSLQTAPPVADVQVAALLTGDGCSWLSPWASLWPASGTKAPLVDPARES